MAKAVEGLIVLMPSLKGAVQSAWSWMQGATADIAEWIVKNGTRTKTDMTAGMNEFLMNFAEMARAQQTNFAQMSAANIEKASSVVVAFDALFQALDELKAGLSGAGSVITVEKAKFDALGSSSLDLAGNLERVTSELDSLDIIEVPIEMDLSGVAGQASLGLDIIDEFTQKGADLSAAASEKARAEMQSFTATGEQMASVMADGFISIARGAESMGEALRNVVDGMIADLARLTIKEIMSAQMAAVAHAIAGIFKSFPWFVAIPLAAGAFAVVSKLFSKLLKFDEGAVFEEKTLLPAHTVAENDTEYYLPEKKLLSVFRDALSGMGLASGMMTPALAGAAAAGPAPTITIHQTVNVQSLDRRTVREARNILYEEMMSITGDRGRR
ncbi:MAG: hypothetical protein ABFD52_04870 [Acidobacteriota bacterium]